MCATNEGNARSGAKNAPVLNEFNLSECVHHLEMSSSINTSEGL